MNIQFTLRQILSGVAVGLGLLFAIMSREALAGGNIELGMNLTGLSDWSSQWVFVDLMKQARPWITQEAGPGYNGKKWDTGLEDKIETDADGYPLQVPFVVSGAARPQVVVTVVGNESHPAGEYTFMSDGDGDIVFWGTGVTYVKSSTPLTDSSLSYTVTLAPKHGPVFLTVISSSVTNHLRNMRLIMPGFLQKYKSQPFHPIFLERLKGFSVIRYMDLESTNGNPLTTWSQRTTPTYFTQARPQGIAAENIAALANTTKTDIWVTIPHAASDEYVQKFAYTLFTLLNRSHKVYIEYSNEVWNWGFVQTTWMHKAACANPLTFVKSSNPNLLVPGCDDGAAAFRYHAMRLAKIYDIFFEVFGSQFPSRVVKVAAVQAVNTWATEQLLEKFNDKALNPKGYKPDTLAIAPYFGYSVANAIYNAGTSSSVSVDEILLQAQVAMTNDTFPAMTSMKRLADSNGLKLIAYEGGQHLVGVGGAQNDDTLTQKLIAANRSPVMQKLYLQYFDYWFNNVNGGLFVHFANVSTPSKYGSWGALEYQDQPLQMAPKYNALLKFMLQ